ncbi:unnamed protein product, partial [Iphiclides podalirius]
MELGFFRVDLFVRNVGWNLAGCGLSSASRGADRPRNAALLSSTRDLDMPVYRYMFSDTVLGWRCASVDRALPDRVTETAGCEAWRTNQREQMSATGHEPNAVATSAICMPASKKGRVPSAT